jgi:pimeloyl-ACP methyl ester carboxylesterase
MEVHYRDEGILTDFISLILTHGTASSLHTYNAWSAYLKKTTPFIRMGLPAFGTTGPFPDRDYSMAHYTGFIKDFLTAINIKKCVLVGS